MYFSLFLAPYFSHLTIFLCSEVCGGQVGRRCEESARTSNARTLLCVKCSLPKKSRCGICGALPLSKVAAGRGGERRK